MTDIVERLRAHPGPALTVTEQFRIMVEQRHEAAAEIERLTLVLTPMADEIERLEAKIERLTEAHERIIEWSRAYPLTIFPEPDLKKARVLLETGGITLDAISAHAMRHVIDQVAKISRGALAAMNDEAEEPKP